MVETEQINKIKIYGYSQKEKKSAENLLSAYSVVNATKIVVDTKAVYSLLNIVFYISDVSENSSNVQDKIMIHQAAYIGKDQNIAHLFMN